MTLDDVADELYGLDPGEFVEARTKHVKAARDDNDRTLAAEIGKLRKPTTVGWLVNLISRDAPEDLDALLALGESLRDAQRHLSGPDLRRLTTQRQQVVRSLATNPVRSPLHGEKASARIRCAMSRRLSMPPWPMRRLPRRFDSDGS